MHRPQAVKRNEMPELPNMFKTNRATLVRWCGLRLTLQQDWLLGKCCDKELTCRFQAGGAISDKRGVKMKKSAKSASFARFRRVLIAIACFAALAWMSCPPALAQDPPPMLVLISIDGLRPDYVTAADAMAPKCRICAAS